MTFKIQYNRPTRWNRRSPASSEQEMRACPALRIIRAREFAFLLCACQADGRWVLEEQEMEPAASFSRPAPLIVLDSWVSRAACWKKLLNFMSCARTPLGPIWELHWTFALCALHSQQAQGMWRKSVRVISEVSNCACLHAGQFFQQISSRCCGRVYLCKVCL
jgi:hypothetical protein